MIDGRPVAQVGKLRYPSAPKPTLVLGLGNPILRDDGVGWRVVDEARRRCRDESVEFDTVALGGISLMERLIGYDRAVLVDAIQTDGSAAGQVRRLTLDDLPTLHADAIHDASLKAALVLGCHLGARLPTDITIIAVEAVDVLDFGDTLSPAVEAAVPAAVDLVLALLHPVAVSGGDGGGTRGIT